MDDKQALAPEVINEKLKTLPGWTYANDKISKEFKFADFLSALKLVDDLAPFCEEHDHHPDIHIYYNRIVFDLQRFDIGGKVTARDFLVAERIEQLYAAEAGKK